MKKLLSVLLTIVFLISAYSISTFTFTASAATIWNTVPNDNYVYDTLTYNGVTTNALFPKSSTMYSGKYNSDSTYSCAALPVRFFKNYGISIKIPEFGSPSVLDGSGTFIQVSTPQIGDVLRKPGQHWAIVKAVSGNIITLFEQNYWWNDNGIWKAGKNRTISQSDIDNGTWVLYRCTSFNSSTSGSSSINNVTINNIPSENTITDTNAILWGQVDKPSSYAVTKIGIRVRKDGSTYDKGWSKYEAPSKSYVDSTYMQPYYNMNTELNVTLTHATKYYYQIYAVVNGSEYWSSETEFTTTGSHSYSSWVATTAATCTSAGTQTRSCACGKTETQTINATGHNYSSSFTIDKEATCAEAGSKSRHCTKCGSKTEVTEIPKWETHSIDGINGFDWIKEPNCTEDGICNIICNYCGVILENVTNLGSALGHTAADKYIISNNYHYEHCKVCGENYNPQPHNLDDNNICVDCGYLCEYIAGDINDDKSINNKDLGLLMQHLNDWDVEINVNAADVNADGKINNKDYGILMQYLNDWEVELQ